MKFRLRLHLKKKSLWKKKNSSRPLVVQRTRSSIHSFDRVPFEQSNNMSQINDGSGDDRQKLWRTIPKPVNEQQIANAQMKVDQLMNLISDTYEKTLIRNLRLEDLDMRSTDLFRDAEKMKNMAHKMHDKFFWEDSKCSSSSLS